MVEDSEDQENLKALKNSQIGMTQESYPYGTCETIRAVSTQDQDVGERPEHGALELKVFVKKTPGQEISTMD